MSVIAYGGFRFFEPGFDAVFRSPVGPVGQHIERIAQAVVVSADENIIEATPFYPHEGFPFSVSGDLKASIAYRMDMDDDGVVASIGANAQHRGFDYPRRLETGEASIYGTRFPWLSAACIAMGLDYRPMI